MEDLVQTNSGQLTDELVKMHGIFAKHIKLDCMVRSCDKRSGFAVPVYENPFVANWLLHAGLSR